MSPPTIEEIDSSWKIQLRERIMKSLEVMLQGAHIAYQNKLAEVPSTAHEERYRLQIEYTQDQKNLRRYADEELRFELEREEQERQWCLQSVQHQQPEVEEEDESGGAVAQWKQSVVHDQVMILNAIKNQTGHMDGHTSGLFQQGSSSKPSPFYGSPSSKLPSSHSPGRSDEQHYTPHSQTGKTEIVTTDPEVRLRLERQAKQQEEFRQRAEAIKLRKKRERGWDSYPESLSSCSSTSSSDQESSTTTDNTSTYSTSPQSDPVSRLTEEEFVNLVIFHDQQWDWITTLTHLQWTDFPWPVLSFSGPTRMEDLTLDAVADYVFAPLRLHHDRTMSKERLKEIIRRWHPDRFEVKYLARVVDIHEKELVREGAGMVARFLNDLLGKWNDV